MKEGRMRIQFPRNVKIDPLTILPDLLNSAGKVRTLHLPTGNGFPQDYPISPSFLLLHGFSHLHSLTLALNSEEDCHSFPSFLEISGGQLSFLKIVGSVYHRQTLFRSASFPETLEVLDISDLTTTGPGELFESGCEGSLSSLKELHFPREFYPGFFTDFRLLAAARKLETLSMPATESMAFSEGTFRSESQNYMLHSELTHFSEILVRRCKKYRMLYFFRFF